MVSWNAIYALVGPEAPHHGLGCYAQPYEAKTSLDFTGKIGTGTNLFYALVFQIPKWGWKEIKVDEWINISPVHAQYFQLTTQQKEQLESKIKQGLASVSQAVADLELLKHDLRKYREFINYIENKDEASLKAIFVDQVDFYTGGAAQGAGRLSMAFMRNANIMPTIVQDFMSMQSLEDLEKDKYLSNLPKVERDMLKVKWKAYEQWKHIFSREVKERYKSLLNLVRSRRMSVEEYKNWLKPYIAKHKLIEEGLSRPSIRKAEPGKYYKSAAQAVSENSIEIFAWYYIDVAEFKKTSGELFGEKSPPVLDEFIKRNFIFDLAADFPNIRKKLRKNGEKCLVEEFPWITEKWVEQKTKELIAEGSFWTSGKEQDYYSVFPIKMQRDVYRLPDGSELEDITFDISGKMVSKNILLVKLLEIKAKHEEFERYVNQLVGSEKYLETVRYIKKGKKFVAEGKEFETMDKLREEYPEEFYKLEEDKEKKRGFLTKITDPIHSFFNYFGIPLKFLKRGPYERDFYDRIPNFHLMTVGGRFNTIVNFLQSQMGVGH
ncbi:MAG: hypothetical protein J7J92_03815 [Candidatus Aenigmarchaeota archaeon]|nr:hypothetical protein [Candidatus Aenigmarchaeota archaeon]